MSNPVDNILTAEDDGATFVHTAAGKWAAKDRDGAFVVRDAESMAEAARLYIEDRTLPTTKPSTPDAILAGICAEYAPYDAIPEFHTGFGARLTHHYASNPYHPDSVEAQAWDRGANAARRYARAIEAAERGAVVERSRSGKAVR